MNNCLRTITTQHEKITRRATLSVTMNWQANDRFFFVRSSMLGDEHIYATYRLGGLYSKKLWQRSWKCCPNPQAEAEHFQDLGYSFLPYGPTLSRQMTFLFSHSLKSFFFNSFTSTRTNTSRFANAVNWLRCKDEILHFNIVIKICFEREAFVFQFYRPIRSCFEERFCSEIFKFFL